MTVGVVVVGEPGLAHAVGAHLGGHQGDALVGHGLQTGRRRVDLGGGDRLLGEAVEHRLAVVRVVGEGPQGVGGEVVVQRHQPAQRGGQGRHQCRLAALVQGHGVDVPGGFQHHEGVDRGGRDLRAEVREGGGGDDLDALQARVRTGRGQQRGQVPLGLGDQLGLPGGGVEGQHGVAAGAAGGVVALRGHIDATVQPDGDALAVRGAGAVREAGELAPGGPAIGLHPGAVGVLDQAGDLAGVVVHAPQHLGAVREDLQVQAREVLAELVRLIGDGRGAGGGHLDAGRGLDHGAVVLLAGGGGTGLAVGAGVDVAAEGVGGIHVALPGDLTQQQAGGVVQAHHVGAAQAVAEVALVTTGDQQQLAGPDLGPLREGEDVIVLGIEDPVAGEVDGLAAEVLQLHEVVALGVGLVDDDRADDVRGALGGDVAGGELAVGELRALPGRGGVLAVGPGHGVHEVAVGGEEAGAVALAEAEAEAGISSQHGALAGLQGARGELGGGLGVLLVQQVPAVQLDRAVGDVEDLDPVVTGGVVGGDLADAQRIGVRVLLGRGRGHVHAGVGGALGLLGGEHDLTVHDDPAGQRMLIVGDAVDEGGAVGEEQAHLVAVAQPEVEAAGAGVLVLDHDVLAGRYLGALGDGPVAVVVIVLQVPARDVHRLAADVGQLDPVQSVGLHLGDLDVGLGGQGGGGQAEHGDGGERCGQGAGRGERTGAAGAAAEQRGPGPRGGRKGGHGFSTRAQGRRSPGLAVKPGRGHDGGGGAAVLPAVPSRLHHRRVNGVRRLSSRAGNSSRSQHWAGRVMMGR